MNDKLMENLSTDPTLELSSKFFKKRTKSIESECKICGCSARYSYFGVLSCISCKMFFKRNAELGQESFKCDFDEQCQININNRHICTSCRLAKCFKCGMKMENFRLSGSKIKNQSNKMKTLPISTDLIKLSKRNEIKMLPTLNLLLSDTSLMTNSQWNVLSNLIHNYDESKLLITCQRLINEDEYNKSLKPINEASITEFFSLLFETIDVCLRSNGDLCSLSSDDRSILLRTGSDCLICLGGAFILYLSQLEKCRSFLDVINNKYGKHSVALTLHSIKYMDPDIVVMKMALLLFVFSKNLCLFSSQLSKENINTSAIFLIQNKYAEITWRYLIYRYGYYDAVIRFMNLIQCLLAVIQTMYHLQTVQSHVEDVILLAENTELKLILDDIDQINQTYMN
ncbi:unnamed protein product [Rotaria sp. Silwood1]|nr:unnamed protein product [Rotaria sp. Silwood1]CAF3648898.1 unnamed protein product [Rotaria sp. Silwood1]CAF4539637.1 unnamed protein product [Rotaria sp. Silwood1]